MGLLDKLNSGPTQNKQSLVGKTPGTRSAALPTSQMHAQGNFGEEAPGFGKVNNEFVARNQAEATNLKYKKTKEYSALDLNGVTPATRAAALPTSQMHAQGNFGQEAPGFGKIDKGFIANNKAEATNVKYKSSREYSTLDLDGGTPSTYYDNLPG